MRRKVLALFGTRPEAIKMAPVVRELQERADIALEVCVTAQHRTMLDSVLELFAINPDYDLNVMRPGQDLYSLSTALLNGIKDILAQARPDLVLVHGDTTTCFIGALASFYQQVKVAHVEAGLRTGNLSSPWPEEANRKLTATLATLHFAPTFQARANLLAEGIAEDTVHVTGNTVIDALLQAKKRLDHDPGLTADFSDTFAELDHEKKIILVTGHRRESFGRGFAQICAAIREIVERHQDGQVVYPVHLNPNVLGPVTSELANRERIILMEPLDYLPFVSLMARAEVILTDSGGIQEEAPSLGKPVLVMRDNSERPEAIEAGTVRLVGTEVGKITTEVAELLTNRQSYEAMSRASNPSGDGLAAGRIADVIEAGEW